MSDELTHDQGIEKLRALPEDKQRAVLQRLSPDERKGILAKLSTPARPPAGRPLPGAPKSDVYTWRNPKEFLQQTAEQLGEASQSEAGKGSTSDVWQGGKLAAPRSGLNRAAHQALSGLAGGGEVIAKISAGLMDWKTAAALLVGRLNPAAAGAFFATQGGKAAYDAIKNGQATPENVQNFLLALAGIAGSVAAGAEGGSGTPLREAAGKASAKIRETVSSSRPVKALVKETQAENAKGAAKSAEEHATHAEAVGHEQARAAKTAQIQEGGELLDVKTEKARHDALAEGNKKYSAVNEKLSHLPADKAPIQDAQQEALAKIRGTDVTPPILKSIGDRIQEESLVYSDLQGYYSELGRELSKGTLPGDVYSAYDTMHEAIGEQMQKIADENGAGAQLKDARAYWKRMKQTFGKSSDAANNRAAKLVKDQAPETIDQQQHDYSKRLLGSFDSDIPNLADKIAEKRDQLDAIPNKKAGPAPKPFEPAKIGAEDVEATKRESLQKRADWVRTRGQWAATWPVFYVLRDVLKGNGFPIGEAAMEAGGTLAAAHGIARALENPRVVKFLTKATAKDVAAIPPDLRGSFPNIIQQATQQGKTVSPALRLLFAGSVNARPPAPRAGNDTDPYAGTEAH